jgi:cyclic pyranopterin phosphate synthase
MPAEGLPWLERDEVLSFEEIARLVGLLAEMGVHDVRLTGGEPLVRREFPTLAAMLAAVPGVEDLSITTNGYLLERDAERLVRAGINRFNVSIDSLQQDRFFEMTRRDALPRVLRGLEALARFPEAHPIKVNAVAMRGFTEDEALPFARFAREHPYEVRFIEFMPLDADHNWTPDSVLTGAEIRAAIHAVYPLEREPREAHATARVYRFADGRGKIGFINPVSEPFCGDCNRIRLTADGRLRTCLFSISETDLRTPLRSGASDDEIERILSCCAWRDRSTPGPGCGATAAGPPTSKCRSTTRASTRSTPRPASAPKSWTRCRRPSCSASTACTTSRTSASATAASSRSRTAGSG